MTHLTRSDALHALPSLNAKEAAESWARFLNACHDATKNERDLMEAYQEMARFLVHTDSSILQKWCDSQRKSLTGTNLNRFVYLCFALTLCTYDPEKEAALKSVENFLDPCAPLEPLLSYAKPTRPADSYLVSRFRLTHSGVHQEFNQIAQTGFA